jgi:hypothetical protein
MREYSDAIKLPKSYPPTVVGRDYRLSNFWLAKEVNKELKKEVAASVFIKNIKYYENTNCTLTKGKKNQHNCSSHKCRIFFRAIKMHRKRNISAECECIAKYKWSHF